MPDQPHSSGSPPTREGTAVASAPDVPPAPVVPTVSVNLPKQDGNRINDASPPAPPATPSDPPPADPQAVRDSAAAEVAALGPLHDELIEVLEAIQEALTDREEKRQAGIRVAMAQLAKRHDMGQLEASVDAEPEWRVRGARRRAGMAKARLERDIEEAKATLTRLRGGPTHHDTHEDRR
ncbi:MAG: hypothetical protein OXN18_15550 [Gemmatimonadota bacterium]|nr:hypothetical protein [Gemmatimonadota bacterium]